MAADGKSVLLAETWDGEKDVTGWYLSEKLDGVRAYWTGKTFYSRTGNMYEASKEFKQNMPDIPLDGELWMGRKMFPNCVSVVRKKVPISSEWANLKYLVFDAPKHPGTFEERLKYLQDLLDRKPCDSIVLVKQIKVKGNQHVLDDLDRVESRGGEGLMLRDPKSPYVRGRSSTLLKVKSFFDDEAIVTGHQRGEGRNAHRMGALEVRNAEGVDFKVGTGFTDAERNKPPKIGSIITFRYQELSESGTPRFPAFVGVRIDAVWPPAKGSKPRKLLKVPKKRAASPARAATTPDSDDEKDKDDPLLMSNPHSLRSRTPSPVPSPPSGGGGAGSSSASPTTSPSKPKIRSACLYGSKCYRKNPDHLKDFSHPGDLDYPFSTSTPAVAPPPSSTSDGDGDGSDTEPDTDPISAPPPTSSASEKEKSKDEDDDPYGAWTARPKSPIFRSGKSVVPMGILDSSNPSDLPKSVDASSARPSSPARSTPAAATTTTTSTDKPTATPLPPSSDAPTAATTAAKSTVDPPKRDASPEKKRSPCKYGASCYRKNAEHLKDFCHPGDKDHPDYKPPSPTVVAAPIATTTTTPDSEMKDGERKERKRSFDDAFEDSEAPPASKPIQNASFGRTKSPARSSSVTSSSSAPKSAPPSSRDDSSDMFSFMLATCWDGRADVTGWFVSEKFDGVRAYWDGEKLTSRSGAKITCPVSFLKNFTSFPLDGELWIGRHKQQEVMATLRRPDDETAWRALTFQVFDAPSYPGTFEDRMKFLRENIASSRWDTLQLVDQATCKGPDDLAAKLARVEASGGEGLILRKPDSFYEGRRSASLLKVKSFFDAEAKVVSLIEQKTLAGTITKGAEVETSDGKQFTIPLTEADQSNIPPLGSFVTFKFKGYDEHGLPKDPQYVGVRSDVDMPRGRPASPVAKRQKYSE